ncbi:MAG: CsbD family protein [Actinomycetota bacterium]
MGEKMDEAKGKAKQAAGDLSDDDDLKREGKLDEAGAKAKQKADDAVDKVKDKVNDLTDD